MAHKKIRIKIMDASGHARFRKILAKNKKNYLFTGERKKRYKIWKKIENVFEPIKPKLFRSLAAIGYTKAEFEDMRVWMYADQPGAVSEHELEIELERFARSIKLTGFFNQGETRFEIDAPQLEREPVSAQNERFYGYAKIKGYEYNGVKQAWGWDVRNVSGQRVSKKTRLEDYE